jgi:hypothetical protein
MPTLAGRRVPLAALLLLAVLLAPCAWSADWGADESTLLWEGARLAQGGTIYRDFVTFLPPGAPLVVAATGASLAAAHLLSALLALAAALLLALLSRAEGPRAWVAAVAYVVLLYWPNPTLSHHGLAQAWLLGALAAAGYQRWGLAGGLAGCALLTTQPDGLLAIAVLAGGLLLGACPRERALAAAGRALAGLALPLAAMAAWLASRGVLGEAWQQAWAWPLAHYKAPGGFNDVAWLTDLPGLLSPATPAWHGLVHWYARVVWVLTPYALVIAVALAAMAWLRRREPLPPARLLLGLAALGGLAVCLRGRADYLHTVAYAAPALALAAAARPRCLLALCLAGVGCFGVTMRANPEAWLSLKRPDARLAAQPALNYLPAGAGPVIAGPWGGLFYRQGHMPATRYTLITPPNYRYHEGADRAAIDADLASGRAAYVVVMSEAPPEQAAEALFGHPLTGYCYEATRLLSFHGRPLPCHFYRRAALKPTAGAAEVGIRPIS